MDYEALSGYEIISDPVGAVPTQISMTPSILLSIASPGTVINITVQDVVSQQNVANTFIRSGE